MTKPKRGIQSIEVAGRILACMTRSLKPMKLREIAEATEMSPGQLHAYLVSLKETGLVDQEEGQGRYLLGRFALSMGLARMRSFDPLHHASLALHDLATDLSLLITVSVWDHNRPVIVQLHRGSSDVHIQLNVGASYQLLASAAGLLFSAYLPEDQMRAKVEAELETGYRDKRVTGVATLEDWQNRVAQIRERGYSSLNASPLEGLTAASFPVRDVDGTLAFTITGIGLSRYFRDVPDDPKLASLRDVADRLATEMGFSVGVTGAS